MTDVTIVATDLQFPEGPIAISDGSILLVEIKRGTLTWLEADGSLRRRYELGGGPNGAAFGPDGAVYVCNNGGSFEWIEVEELGLTLPGPCPDTWSGGSIQRVDLDSGDVTTLYTTSTAADGSDVDLRSPNDIVFDSTGGFWFSDHGVRLGRFSDRSGLHYAQIDGSSCRELVFPVDAPNGIGLSPDEKTLYAAETHTGRVWRWSLTGPGEVDMSAMSPAGAAGGTLVIGLDGMQLFDSLAVDGEGNVCVATLGVGAITSVSPDGSNMEQTTFEDPIVTNICFGGDDLCTAYVTLSGTGRLARLTWPGPGAPLAYGR